MIKRGFLFDNRYSVTSDGFVWSHWHRNGMIDRKRPIPLRLKTSLSINGYEFVTIYINTKKKSFRVHCLVALAFLGPRPKGLLCGHKNDIKTDNRLSNLYYITRSRNALDSKNNGTFARGERQGHSKLKDKDIIEILKLRDKGHTNKQIGTMFNVTQQTIWGIVNGKWWKHQSALAREFLTKHSGKI